MPDINSIEITEQALSALVKSEHQQIRLTIQRRRQLVQLVQCHWLYMTKSRERTEGRRSVQALSMLLEHCGQNLNREAMKKKIQGWLRSGKLWHTLFKQFGIAILMLIPCDKVEGGVTATE
jgi:hypothetical protein